MLQNTNGGILMTIYDLKPKFQNLLRPLCRALERVGVTANTVTIAAVLLSIAGGAALVLAPTSAWPLFLLPAVLFVRMALNAIDGMLAREFDQKSRLGAVLNELGDVVSDIGLYVPLVFHTAFSPTAVVAFVLAGLLTEFVGVQAIQIGSPRRYDGPFGKSDRAFVIGLLALLAAWGVVTASITHGVLIVGTLLSIVTVTKRGRAALATAPESI